MTSTVEVSAAATLIQTEAPVRGCAITTQNIIELPIASQNPVSLALTLPGVSANRYTFGWCTFSVNGGRGRSNNFLIDGTENNDISVTTPMQFRKSPCTTATTMPSTGERAEA